MMLHAAQGPTFRERIAPKAEMQMKRRLRQQKQHRSLPFQETSVYNRNQSRGSEVLSFGRKFFRSQEELGLGIF
jgi:hypothetical protein